MRKEGSILLFRHLSIMSASWKYMMSDTCAHVDREGCVPTSFHLLAGFPACRVLALQTGMPHFLNHTRRDSVITPALSIYVSHTTISRNSSEEAYPCCMTQPLDESSGSLGLTNNTKMESPERPEEKPRLHRAHHRSQESTRVPDFLPFFLGLDDKSTTQQVGVTTEILATCLPFPIRISAISLLRVLNTYHCGESYLHPI